MNEIEKMIESLCPDGVEFRALDELGYFYGGLTGKTKAHFENGNYKYVTYMNIYKNPSLNINISDMVKINEGENQNKIEYGDILFTGSSETADECGMSSVVNEKINEDIYLNSFCFGFRLNNVSDFSIDYLKHLFRSRNLRKQISLTASGVTRFNISKKKFAKVIIPIPPLEIQEKIVKVLDIFTELEATLEATLEAELSARKQQYEYYRNKLLTFDSITDRGGYESNLIWQRLAQLCPQGVPMVALGEVCKYAKNRIGAERLNSENYVGVDNLLPNKQGKKSSDYVPIEGNLIAYELGNILIGNIRPYLKKIWLADNYGGTNGDVLVFQLREEYKNKLLPKYLYYVLSSDLFFAYDTQHSKGAKMPRGDKTANMKYEFSLPPLEIQQMIVDILDKFDKLVNDLTAGLPAEINARRKQYEYYRERLLSFNEKI